MAFTKQQEEAIKDNSPKLLVSAAAGAGKTSVLVERILRMLTVDKLSLDRMLVLTFTNSAASELKERISKRLFDMCLEMPELQRELDSVSYSHIETMHSFCGKLIRQEFQAVNVDSRVKTCSTSLRDRLFEKAMDKALDACYDEPTEEMEALIENYNEKTIREFIANCYYTIMSFPEPFQWLSQKTGLNLDFTVNEDIQAADLFGNMAQITIKGVFARIMLVYNKSESFLETVKNEGFPDKYIELCQDDINVLLPSYDFANKEDKAAFEALKLIKFKNMPIIKGENPHKLPVSNYRDSLKKELENINAIISLIKNNENDTRHMLCNLQGLAQMTLSFCKEFDKIKRRVNVIDFHDMEHMALKILNTEGLKEKISGAFDAIFIDECQDNAAIQEAILAALHNGKNKLFMVGDVKQSIYRFRQADPSFFMEKMRNYPYEPGKNERKILLNKNFRSNPLIIDSVNRVFSKLMREDVSELNYTKGEDWLEAGREEKFGVKTKFTLLKNATEELHNIQLQALYVAKQIKALIGKTMPNSDKKLEYRDVAILCSQMKDVDNVIKAVFAQYDIPLYADIVTQETASLEIEQVLYWLTMLYQPLDDLALLAILRGPIFNVSDEILSNIRLQHPQSDISFAQAFYSCADAADALEEFKPEIKTTLFDDTAQYSGDGEGLFDLIDDNIVYKQKESQVQQVYDEFSIETDWTSYLVNNKLLSFRKIANKKIEDYILPQKANDMGISQFEYAVWKLCADIRRILSQERFVCENMRLERYLWTFINRSGLFMHYGVQENGEEKQNNLRNICFRARRFIDEDNGGQEDFIKDCRSIQKSGDSLNPVLLSPYDNLVRLMTIHKSKGLEFPVVFVIGMEKSLIGNMDKNAELLIHAKHGMALNYRNGKKHIYRKTLQNETIKAFKIIESRAERLRLLYVAMTRAKEVLYLVGSLKPNKIKEDIWSMEDMAEAIGNANSFSDWICQAIYNDDDAIPLRNEPEAFSEEALDNEFLIENIDDISSSGEFKNWHIRFLELADSPELEIEQEEKRQADFDINAVFKDLDNMKIDEELPPIDVIRTITKIDDGILKMPVRLIPKKTTVTTVCKVLRKNGELNFTNPLSDSPVKFPKPHKLPDYRPKSVKYTKSNPLEIEEEKPPTAAEIGSFTHLLLELVELKAIRKILHAKGSDLQGYDKLGQLALKNQEEPVEKTDIYNEIQEAFVSFKHGNLSPIAKELYELMENTLSRMVQGELLSQSEADTVDTRAVAQFFLTELGIRMLNSHAVFREKHFTVFLKGWETEIMQGVIDLCFLERGQWILVDFKTDKTNNPNELQEKYIPQLSMYKLALEISTPYLVKECYLYSVAKAEGLRI